MRPQWEYLVLTLRGYKYEKEETLRRAGYQGWELVSREGDECTFKRPWLPLDGSEPK